MRAWVLAAACAMALGAGASGGSIEVIEQSGVMTVDGELGSFSAHAPGHAPWFETINAGAGGPIWFAQAFIFTGWSEERILIYAEALASPGTSAPKLTQSRTDLSIRFRVDAPTWVKVLFTGEPDQSAGMPLNQHTMRLRNVGSGEVVGEGETIAKLRLGAGEYLLEAENDLGNLPDAFAMGSGARMLSIDLLVIGCPLDFNADGFVNADDFDAFGEAFEHGSPVADFNGDGFVNGDDFDQFALGFEQGC
ncbi:MAG: hypothetical protein JNL50_04490 [Phycisphaerae bacterium]|nr:hypothetical protein [Phycisphaerae bacterium]